MLFRSNAARHFTGDQVIHSHGQINRGYPQDIHTPVETELLWLTGSESPIDRQTLLGELYAERFDLRGKRKR